MSDDDRTRLAAFAELAQRYQSLLQAADAQNPAVEEWQAITALGEELLAGEAEGLPGLDWAALARQVAGDYNTLGNALDNRGDKAASLAAYERACALQPDFAMWQRNRTGMLIELGRLDEAAQALAQARALEPDADRLPQLAEQLAAARGEPSQ